MSEIHFSSDNFTELFLPEDTLRYSLNYYSISRKHSPIFFHLHLPGRRSCFYPICKHCQGDPHFSLNCVACGVGVSPNRGWCKCIGTFLQWVLKPEPMIYFTYDLFSCITSFHLQTFLMCTLFHFINPALSPLPCLSWWEKSMDYYKVALNKSTVFPSLVLPDTEGEWWRGLAAWENCFCFAFSLESIWSLAISC